MIQQLTRLVLLRVGQSSVECPDANSVRRARAFVGQLASSYLPDPAPAVLLTSELVANVILHAHTTVTVSVKPGPPFRVEVHDGVGATVAFRELVARKPPPAPETATSGRHGSPSD